MSSSYRWNKLGLSHWDCYAVRRGSCLELYYCNMVKWVLGIQAWSRQPTGFLQCFDTVGLVIWPVKIIPEMTYNVLSGTLSLYTTTTIAYMSRRKPCLFGSVSSLINYWVDVKGDYLVLFCISTQFCIQLISYGLVRSCCRTSRLVSN